MSRALRAKGQKQPHSQNQAQKELMIAYASQCMFLLEKRP